MGGQKVLTMITLLLKDQCDHRVHCLSFKFRVKKGSPIFFISKTAISNFTIEQLGFMISCVICAWPLIQ